MALISVALAQIYYPGQTVYTGVGEVAIDGHSKIAYQGYRNPVINANAYGLNGYGLNAYGLNYFRR